MVSSQAAAEARKLVYPYPIQCWGNVVSKQFWTVGHSMMVLPLTGATSVDESIIICPQVLQGGLVKICGVYSHST